jgi:glyoxylase I family protein
MHFAFSQLWRSRYSSNKSTPSDHLPSAKAPTPSPLTFTFYLSPFSLMFTHPQTLLVLSRGMLQRVHHIALNVKDMQASRHFYGTVLGLHELQGDEVPLTLKTLVGEGKVANFVTPDGMVIDLFWEPELSPPAPDPCQQFTRANHLAFDIEPSLFDQVLEVLRQNQVTIDHGPVTRPTGRGIYFYDPDGFLIEIRCDPQT